MDTFLTDYIKAIENPNKIGWNGKVWAASTLEGYDKNQRGYGIDIKRNIEARNLTKDRLGQWITEKEADTLMNNHLKYIEGVAKRRIKGFDNFSKEKQAAILGMLYRGDSVQSNVNINEPDDMKFLDSVHTYYKSKGLNERASNSENFFLNKTKKRNIPIVDYSFSEYSLPQDNTIVKKPIIFNKQGGYIRKMQTAAGGPLRIKFTPEQIAQFERQATRVPGTNNSGRNKYREEGVQAQQHQEQEVRKKEEEIKSRMEMRPTIKRKATTAEKLQGKKDEYEQTPQVVGMSGADPLLSFYVGGVGLNGIGALAKTGLWNAAKYVPTTQLGNWGRQYFVGNAFKNSFNGTVPTLSSQATSLLYQPIKQNETGLTSLKFFERKPSRISETERLGVPKGERNQPFKPKQPTEHVQGDEAVKMFKEYGGEPIPEGSINGEQLRKYVAEARERYGLVGNNNVTDEEIAQALYKHSKELGGNTAAVNAQGEPQLLFRGDTQRYTQLKERMSPEELATKSGTMDNSLGNLFLGEFPDSWRGVDRYIGTWRNFNGSPKLVGSGTGSKVVWDGKIASEIEGYPYLGPQAGGGYKLYSQPHRYGNIDVYKLPASMMESGVNDLNAFIVRTPQMRNASSEISVLNDDWMLQGAKDSHFMSKNYKYNPKTYSMENVKTGESLGEITTESAPESRAAMGDHYKELLKEAEQKQQGLLKSEANAPLRDEHSQYSYFALPNFNIQGAKHLLPYDLRIPRNWKDKNIYRGLIPLTTGYTLYNLFNQPQLQYQKQGGKMNIIEFLKNGSGIHIKKKNRGSFTRWCGGNVTEECIRRGKASSNPKIRKKATFADNARHFKHKSGGQIVQEFKRIRKNNLGGFLLGNMDKIQALAGTLGNYINNERKIPQNPFNGMTVEWLINKKNNPSYNTLEQYPDAQTSPMEAFYTQPNNNEELAYLRNLENVFDMYKNQQKQKNTEALISGVGDFAKSFII